LSLHAGVVINPYIDYSRYMDIRLAVNALEALAHETRLSVFRLLVQAGPAGLTAGAIADRLDARQNTMSSHLGKLHRAGIVTSERDGRHIIYRADFDAVSGLIVYLMEDCCGGNAKVCKPVAASINC
jgi:DNA-binding transcriptional ArsR family regulator